MKRKALPWLTVVLVAMLAHAALGATSTVVLTVEGMT